MANYDTGTLSIADLQQHLTGDLRRAENNWQEAKQSWEMTGDPTARTMMLDAARQINSLNLEIKQLSGTAEAYLTPPAPQQPSQEERFHRPISAFDAQDMRDLIHTSKYYDKGQDPLRDPNFHEGLREGSETQEGRLRPLMGMKEYMARVYREQRERAVRRAVEQASKTIEATKDKLGDELCGVFSHESDDARKEAFKALAGHEGFSVKEMERLFQEAKKRRDHEIKTYVGGARHVVRNY